MSNKSGLRALVAATPIAGETVEIDGVDVFVGPIPVLDIVAIAMRRPDVAETLFEDGVSQDKVIATIQSQGQEFMVDLVMIAAREKGDEALKADLMQRAEYHLMPVVEAAIRQTMPAGVEDFFGRLFAVARTLGMVKESDGAETPAAA